MATDTGTQTHSGGKEGGVLTPVTNWIENLSESAYAYLLLTPAFALLTLVAFWPLAATFRMSLLADQTRGAESIGGFVGLENYVNVLTGDVRLARQFFDIELASGFPFIELGTPFFQQALFVTMAFALLNVLFTTLIGFGQALILDQDFRGRRWVRVAIIIPWAVPIVIQGMIFFLFFQPTVGFGSGVMQSLGLFSGNPLANSQDSFFIVLIADIWKTSAFMALLILAGLQSVDRSLYDVAKVSGASPWQRFKMITFPLVLPALLVAMLFRTMEAMRIYGLIESTAGCTTVPSMTCLVIEGLFGGTRIYGTAAAVAFITAAIIGLLISLYIVKFRDSEGGLY